MYRMNQGNNRKTGLKTWRNQQNQENLQGRGEKQNRENQQEHRNRQSRRNQQIQRRNRYFTFGFICILVVIALLAGYLTDKEKKEAQEAVKIEAENARKKEQEEQEQAKVTKKGLADNEFLTLLNPWHAVEGETEVTLLELSNGHKVDERCYPDLQDMMDACRAADLEPLICSAYRSRAEQETLFQDQVNEYIAEGYSEEDARKETAKSIAIPGTSEHQLGLALDIVDYNYQILDEGQESTPVQKWLIENSWKYGFVLRYPNEKSEITGIVYEPWHYRYVGKTAAREMHELGVCLEEYLEE